MSSQAKATGVTRRFATGGGAAFALCLIGGISVMAQPALTPSATYISDLKACGGIGGESQRVACYDTKVSAFIRAVDAGDVRLLDRAEVRRTKRQLFGISVPELEILKEDGDEAEVSDLFETTITSAARLSAASWRFTTAEGAVWEINNTPRRLKPITAGDKVVFKKASFGFFFVRINGQIGVKGKRVS